MSKLDGKKHLSNESSKKIERHRFHFGNKKFKIPYYYEMSEVSTDFNLNRLTAYISSISIKLFNDIPKNDTEYVKDLKFLCSKAMKDKNAYHYFFPQDNNYEKQNNKEVEISAIEKRFFPNKYRRILTLYIENPDSPKSELPVGFIIIENIKFFSRTANLSIYLLDFYRGYGLSKIFLSSVFQLLKTNGIANDNNRIPISKLKSTVPNKLIKSFKKAGFYCSGIMFGEFYMDKPLYGLYLVERTTHNSIIYKIRRFFKLLRILF